MVLDIPWDKNPLEFGGKWYFMKTVLYLSLYHISTEISNNLCFDKEHVFKQPSINNSIQL